MAIFNTVPPLKAGSGIQFDGETISTRAAPRNLLDNSNFLQPVNQRGKSTYTGAVYGIDRWRAWEAGVTVAVGPNGIDVNGDTYIWQYLNPDISDQNKIYTFATMTADGHIEVITGTPKAGAQGDMIIFGYDNDRSAISCGLKCGYTYIWAALYEGAYSADTLPVYQPKGYMYELLECKRYYQAFSDNAFLGTGIVTNNYVQGYIATDVQMRVKPTLTGTIGVYNGGSTVTASELKDCSNQGCGLRVNLVLVSTLATSALCIYAQSQVSFSADL